MNRQRSLDFIQSNEEVDVLVIGGGVNGIGTYRDLALQGVSVYLAEKYDFCSGASAASSHMLHGGIRYLENGEFRLVREALHERNRLLKNAPHYAKPLPTTIPIYKWTSGMLNAPLKFIGLLNRPAERGAVIIKAGLTMYDWFTGSEQTMPYHEVRRKEASLKQYPKLNDSVVCTATYYDAWMPYPERICIDMLRDVDEQSQVAHAVNYLGAVAAEGDTVILEDTLTGKMYRIKPKTVINAGGAWIDFINDAMDKPTNFIGGTKGSHLILDNEELYEATGGNEFFFENEDGRIVLICPYREEGDNSRYKRVMVGTTDIRIDNPETAVCTDDEIDYIFNLIPKVFPNIKVDDSQIVYTFSGVRPLPSADSSRTGSISRDHSIKTIEKGKPFHFPIHNLIGGKWTTFRAFSEQTADVALSDINKKRRVDTKSTPIGGGKAYPSDDGVIDMWLETLEKRTEVDKERLQVLFKRYGTYVAEVAEFMGAANDPMLENVPDYSKREIMFIARNEQVMTLDDFLLRRSLIAMLGFATEDAVREVAGVMKEALGWSAKERDAQIDRTLKLLTEKHRMDKWRTQQASTES